jgi:hypothetical protein
MTIGPIMKYQFNAGLFKCKKETTVISKFRLYYKTFLIATRTYRTDMSTFIEYILRIRIQGGGPNVIALIHTINLIKMGPCNRHGSPFLPVDLNSSRDPPYRR